MSTLQVKNLPEQLHAALAARSRTLGLTMSEYVTRLLERDLTRPGIDQWIADQRRTATAPRPIDVARSLDDVRLEYADDASPARAPGR